MADARKPSSLVQATMALDRIALDKMKVNANLDSVDMNMQSLLRMKKIFMGLLIASIVIVLLNVSLVLLFTYIEYKDLIELVNNNASAVPSAPGGFATAIAVKFPALAKTAGFIDSSYPIALFFCLKDPTINAIFSYNIASNMQQMWAYAVFGGDCVMQSSVGIPLPSTLICCGVYGAENIPLCEAPCNAYSNTSTPSIICNCLNTGMNTAQMGSDFGGPPGAIVGFIIGVAAQLGITYGVDAANSQPPCIQ